MSEPNIGSELTLLYLSECGQMIEKFERLIMESDTAERLTDTSEMFRLLHTIKGSSAMMEFADLVEITHCFEDVFSSIKKSGTAPEHNLFVSVIDVGLEFSSYLKEQLERIRVGKHTETNKKLCSMVNLLADKLSYREPTVIKTEAESDAPETDNEDGEVCVTVRIRKCPIPHIRAYIISKSVESLCFTLKTFPDNLKAASKDDDEILKNGFKIFFVNQTGITPESIIKRLSVQPYVESCTREGNLVSSKDADSQAIELMQNVTVRQSVVNRLISCIDEIASAESAVESYIEKSGQESGAMYGLLSVLRRSVSDAEIIASGMGMHSIGSVFVQMQRAVRTMAKDLNKDIKVKTVGADIEIDKSLIEIISDSMIHMVRNAADHGIETPECRVTHGKSGGGTITLKAEKKNDYLTVSVSDDGAGIDRKAVLMKAEQHGRLTKAPEQYSDTELFELLLTAGISTKSEVTQYSGRGVGLDTVVRRIKQAGGTVWLESREGEGTVFSLKIPITLTIVDGIEITLGNDAQVILPANAVIHISTLKTEKEIIYNGTVYKTLAFPIESSSDDNRYALLLESDYGPYFIPAKKVSMMSAYYVKPMPEYIKDALEQNYIYSGCVFGADSRLRCVLDIDRLAGIKQNTQISERQN